jgi:REP element-mobilizing transposase RayT
VARKPRIEIAGGLYHIITRGNNRRRIFRSHDDYLKFLAFLESQKAKRPFYLYAYCLTPNHVHLLAEMLDERISRVMHGLLTGYSQFCTNSKSRPLVMIKEAIIVMGYESEIPTRELAEGLGVDPSAVSKRREAARAGELSVPKMKLLKAMRAVV